MQRRLTGIYKTSDRWSPRASVGVSRLLGDAADSPITQSTLGATYRF
ncbi:MipA/OmpV family protein [Humitalea sp. 24SJ18S-53]